VPQVFKCISSRECADASLFELRPAISSNRPERSHVDGTIMGHLYAMQLVFILLAAWFGLFAVNQLVWAYVTLTTFMLSVGCVISRFILGVRGLTNHLVVRRLWVRHCSDLLGTVPRACLAVRSQVAPRKNDGHTVPPPIGVNPL
jgi:hypothetical protein